MGGYGGLRIGELAGLRTSRIDMLRGVIDIAEQVVEVGGKLSIGPLKTRAARRRVRLPRFVVDELGTHLAKVHGELVFPSPDGGLLSRTRFRTRVWLPAISAAGLEGVRVHDLRHTAAVLWLTGAGGLVQPVHYMRVAPIARARNTYRDARHVRRLDRRR